MTAKPKMKKNKGSKKTKRTTSHTEGSIHTLFDDLPYEYADDDIEELISTSAQRRFDALNASY